ncbi:MAG TPA: polyprenyl synthetase family protein [Candidatus Omnitrophota bacterium]|nr:polyprenyl synthetase family protein [Candidatus Omnitrophota bacterium]
MGNFFETTKLKIERELDRYLPSASTEPKLIHKAMRYSVFSGGKRIRPVIVIASCLACGGRIKDAMPAALAVEFVHTYSLIHDDLPSMDDDDYRRGKPTCHKVFGEANAILAGDSLLTLAFGVMAQGLEPKRGIPAIAELSEAIGTKGMAGGQVLDIAYHDRKKNKILLDRINYLKTARFFEASAKLGAITAGAPSRMIRAMAKYGSMLGMEFQIVDDCLDRDGYVGIMGLQDSKREGRLYTEKAKQALNIFGKKAVFLKEFAENLSKRIV